jgi:hypothetical protein
MIILLLFVQAGLCVGLLYRELVLRSFRNYATSLFYIVYAVVYVVEPLILHIGYGGARSIVTGADDIIEDAGVYLIFNIIGITLLTSSLALSYTNEVPAADAKPAFQVPHFLADAIAVLLVLGTVLFIHSTGLSLDELLIAGRFAWFDSADYTAAYGVVSAYLLALAAVYVYLLVAKAPRSRVLMVAGLGAVLLYGLITKDRKWIFFFLSGWFAAKYYLSGNRIVITWTASLGLSVLFLLVLLSQFIRDALPRYILGQNFDLADELYSSVDYILQYSDLSYFYRATIEAIHQNVNNGFEIFLGLPRRVLFLFLPQGLSGGLKVEDISAIFSDVVGGEDTLRRGSMPPGLFGLFVLSFGWVLSVALMPALALMLYFVDRTLRRSRGLLQLTLATSLLTSTVFAFRGDESTAIYFPVMNMILLALITGFLRLARPAGRKPKVPQLG